MPLPAGLFHRHMTRAGHVVYLHGFASSPGSSKAVRFARELAGLGVGFSCPDFNEPEFETMTVTRMIEQTRMAVEGAPRGPVALVGSSLGGFVAVHAAAADAGVRVDRLVLLAPALDFGGNRLRDFGPYSIQEWRARGRLEVMHYAREARCAIGFGLYEDALRYDAFTLDVPLPTLVFQGRFDDTVSPEVVEAWCAGRPSVSLHLVDDGHQLSGSMDEIWEGTRQLLGLGAPPVTPSPPARRS
jgi:pimeloyl-ACP methyl ester carboxylesterase